MKIKNRARREAVFALTNDSFLGAVMLFVQERDRSLFFFAGEAKKQKNGFFVPNSQIEKESVKMIRVGKNSARFLKRVTKLFWLPWGGMGFFLFFRREYCRARNNFLTGRCVDFSGAAGVNILSARSRKTSAQNVQKRQKNEGDKTAIFFVENQPVVCRGKCGMRIGFFWEKMEAHIKVKKCV